MSDARGFLGASLQGVMSQEYIDALLEEILAQTKEVHAEIACKHCSRKGKYLVEVKDAAAVAKALVELSNQAWGRPDVAAGVDEEKIAFERVVWMTDEDVEGAAV